MTDDEAQAPDTAPGPYYVTVLDHERVGLALGPFATHAEALALVEPARRKASELWREGALKESPVWLAWGTTRFKPDVTSPGVLNGPMGVEPTFKEA